MIAADMASQITGMLPLLMIFVVFYFFLLRPQQKRTKNQRAFMTNLAKGDIVSTNGGIIGKVTKIEDNVVSLQLDQKTFINVIKESLSKELTDAIGDSTIKI